jgi:hypothetical protein
VLVFSETNRDADAARGTPYVDSRLVPPYEFRVGCNQRLQDIVVNRPPARTVVVWATNHRRADDSATASHDATCAKLG